MLTLGYKCWAQTSGKTKSIQPTNGHNRPLNFLINYPILNAMDRAFYTATLDNVSIAYTDTPPEGNEKGVVVLIHGFPQTSYQFRKVIGPISFAG